LHSLLHAGLSRRTNIAIALTTSFRALSPVNDTYL
jgi:hypothetical protein